MEGYTPYQSEAYQSEPYQEMPQEVMPQEEIPSYEIMEPGQYAPAPEEKKSLSAKKIISIIGFACCVIVLVLGIITSSGAFCKRTYSPNDTEASLTTFTSRKAYGGDAYTGMQNASADASNNAAAAAHNVEVSNHYLASLIAGVNNTNETNSTLAGICLISFSLFGMGFYALKFFEEE